MNTEPKKAERGLRPSLRTALKKAPGRLWRLLSHNWPWKLLSLFLALCLWAGLITQDASLTRERVFNDVPVSVTGGEALRRSSGLIVLSGLDDDALNVRMRVDVPQREYGNVTPNSYNPRVDLTRITAPGEQTLKINTTSTITYGSVRSVSPDTVTVLVDEYVTNYRVPVSVLITGDYPNGYYGATPSVDPSFVAISGPRSLVDQIAQVYVDFDVSHLSGRPGMVRTALPMRFVNAAGEPIASDLLEVSSAGVILRTVMLEQTLYPIRTIPLADTALVVGQPADGYRVERVTLSPAVLTAAGDAAALNAVNRLFIDNAVDVTGLSKSFTANVRARKPAELAYVSAETVTVSVEIVPNIVSRTFDGVKVFARGASGALNTALGRKTLSLVLQGPELALQALRGADVTAFVDVADLAAGAYELPVQLHTEGANAEDFTFTASPATVTVTLTEK